MTKHLQQREAFSNCVDILDVYYDQIRDDIFSVVRAIYAHWQRELTPAREQAMRLWIANDIHSKFGSYSLDRYGLMHEDIDSAFSEYYRRFPI